MLATLGDLDLTLTTNGALLAKKARSLRRRGTRPRDGEPRLARRRDVSRDERRRFPGREGARGHRCRGRARARADQDQHGREARHQRVRRSLPMARHFKGSGHIVRFIEYMDVGATQRLADGRRRSAGGGRPRDRRRSCRSRVPIRTTPARSRSAGATADGSGEIGVIASVTQAFCRDCTRARLVDRRQALHVPVRDRRPRSARARCAAASTTRRSAIAIAAVWQRRADRYSEIRSASTAAPAEESR